MTNSYGFMNLSPAWAVTNSGLSIKGIPSLGKRVRISSGARPVRLPAQGWPTPKKQTRIPENPKILHQARSFRCLRRTASKARPLSPQITNNYFARTLLMSMKNDLSPRGEPRMIYASTFEPAGILSRTLSNSSSSLMGTRIGAVLPPGAR